MTAQLGLTTSGWFEVEVFDADGQYVIRRHVETIEEAEALIARYTYRPIGDLSKMSTEEVERALEWQRSGS